MAAEKDILAIGLISAGGIMLYAAYKNEKFSVALKRAAGVKAAIPGDNPNQPGHAGTPGLEPNQVPNSLTPGQAQAVAGAVAQGASWQPPVTSSQTQPLTQYEKGVIV